jgi:hypothetical protein
MALETLFNYFSCFRFPAVVAAFAFIIILAGCSPYAVLRKDPEQHIYGTTSAGFDEVRQAFVENFKERKELGAACAV